VFSQGRGNLGQHQNTNKVAQGIVIADCGLKVGILKSAIASPQFPQSAI
jgi:hypothetical protein